MSDLCPQGLPIYPQGQDPLLIFLIKLQFDSILKPTFSISSHVWCFWCHILYFFNSVYPCVNKFLSFNLHTRVVKFSTFTIYLLLQLDLFFNMCSCPFHYRRLECKSRMSRNTWSNRQIWPWNPEWNRAKANRVLPRKHTGHSKHPLPTTQEKTLHMDITRWSTPKSDWLYSLQPKMEKIYRVSKNKTRSWLWLRSWAPYCQSQT